MNRNLLSSPPFTSLAARATGCSCPTGWIYPQTVAATGDWLSDLSASYTAAAKQVLNNLATAGTAIINKQLGISDVGAYVVLPDGRRGKVVTGPGGQGFQIQLEDGSLVAYTGQSVATYAGGLNKTWLIGGGVALAVGVGLFLFLRRRKSRR